MLYRILQHIFLFITALTLIGCSSYDNQPTIMSGDTTIVRADTPFNDNTQRLQGEIVIDSLLTEAGLRVSIRRFDAANMEPDIPNTIFTASLFSDHHFRSILSDSIFSESHLIEFVDYNADGIRDILVQHLSSARSNRYYHLYLVDSLNRKLRKVKGFNAVGNPEFLPEYNLVESNIVSGRDRTEFYRIIKDSVQAFDIVVYDDHREDNTYVEDREKAIQKILSDRIQNKY